MTSPNGRRPVLAALRPVSQRDRSMAADELDRVCRGLDQLARWLWDNGTEADERTAELIRDAWRCLAAAGWSLDRPAQPRSEGWRSG